MKKLLALGLAALASHMACAATAEEDVAHYVEAVQGPRPVRVKAIDELAWKGISDPRVFDLIEKMVLAELEPNASGGDSNAVNQELRGLSYSGQGKYMATLRKAEADSRYTRYAKMAMTELTGYARWNPIISDRSTWDPRNSDDDNRILNMLHSKDLVLERIAGKRMYFENKDPVVLDAAAEAIKAVFHDRHSGDEADGVAWLVKGLGSAGAPQYKALIIQVQAESPDNNVVSHAATVLSKNYGGH